MATSSPAEFFVLVDAECVESPGRFGLAAAAEELASAIAHVVAASAAAAQTTLNAGRRGIPVLTMRYAL